MRPAPLSAFTVDLEEWFQGLTSTNPLVEQWPTFPSRVVPATRHLLALLARYRVRATFFVLGHVADHHPALIEEVAAAGHEIATHGYWHRFVARMAPDDWARDLDASLEALARRGGHAPIGYRAPYFSASPTTPWLFDGLVARGLRYDSSVFPTRNMLYGWPGAPRFPHRRAGGLAEFPPSTLRVAGVTMPIAGGFYLRALPYALVRAGIRSLHRQGQPAILYLHPWELDLAQPRPRVTARERLTHFHGRRRLEAKLHRLFSEFRFVPLHALLDALPLPQAPTRESTPVP